MKNGQESQTAVMVCLGRAFAEGRTPVTAFSDPTARILLPEHARARLDRLRTTGDAGWRGKMERSMLDHRSQMMVVRTVVIDEALRSAQAPQVVILGAGLDGRAWRMPELRAATVFEVDHPDSQREKRARARQLTPAAREIRFVPIDFTRDRLDDALAAAGHEPMRPTAWIWEGVVMYLRPAEIEASLATIQLRSAPGSRLVIAYHSPALMLRLVGFFVRRVGEPLRTALTAQEMRLLLARFDFTVIADESVPEAARRLSPELARALRAVGHARIVTANRHPAR